MTNHICGCVGIVTVFVENEAHSNLVRLVGKMLSCRTCLVLCGRAGRKHCTFAISNSPNVPFDHKHDIRFFAFSSFSLRRRSSDHRCDGPNNTSALVLTFGFAFTFALFLSEGMVGLCTRLYQLCTNFGIKIIVPCISEKSNRVRFSCLENNNIVQSNIRRKRVVFLVVIMVQSFFSVIVSGWSTGSLWA